MPVLRWRLGYQSAIPLPVGPEKIRRLDVVLVHRIKEVIHTGHDIGTDQAYHALRIHRFSWLQQHHIGESTGAKSLQGPPDPRRTLADVAHAPGTGKPPRALGNTKASPLP